MPNDNALRLISAFKLRLLQEPVALELAFRRINTDDINAAERILVECEMKATATSQFETVLKFYMRLMSPCHDSSLLAKVSRVQTAVLDNISEQECVRLSGELAQHRRWLLLELCRSGEVDSAVRSLRESIEDACLRLCAI